MTVGPWSFHCPTRIVFGAGALAQLAGEARGAGLRRPLVVSDPGVAKAGLLDQALAALHGAHCAIYAQVPSNPTLEAVEEALALYRAERCDGIVAVGGGSAIDAGKAVALLASNPGPLSAYHVFQPAPRQPSCALPPVVAVSTTAGTGSEVSRGIGIAERGGHAKIVALHPLLFPAVAVCDPTLTTTLPPALTAGTGIDALVHCIEAFCSTSENAVIEALALDGAARIWRFLPRAVEDGTDLSARAEVMAGALLGGLSMLKGLGLAHAFALSLEDQSIHHGTLVGLLLPRILSWTGPVLGAKAARLSTALGIPPSVGLAAALDRFNLQIGLPARLGSLGISRAALRLAASAAEQTPYHHLAPRNGSAAEYLALLEDAS